MARSATMAPTPTVPDPETLRTPWLAPPAATQDVRHARFRVEIRPFHRWVYAVLLGGLVPPLTLFLIVAGGARRRVSWWAPRCWQAEDNRPDEICLAGEALDEPFTALLSVLHASLEKAATASLADPRARRSRRRYRHLKALAATSA